MPIADPAPITIAVEDGIDVSGLLQAPPRARACFVLAHGAGAGMAHPFMAAVARELAQRGIASLRYQFPYMEKGSKRPDPPKLCHTTVRAAVAEAARRSATPLVAGGRSFGGRMTSQAQAETPLPGVVALAFLAFPLHPAKQPSITRADHPVTLGVTAFETTDETFVHKNLAADRVVLMERAEGTRQIRLAWPPLDCGPRLAADHQLRAEGAVHLLPLGSKAQLAVPEPLCTV